jgi:hypothetical protein
LGVFLIASSFQLSIRLSLLAAMVFSLGATIAGPSVLTVEYEPVPRGFAVPLLILAVGLLAHGRHFAADIAAAAAFLYHPPTTYPYWTMYFALAVFPAKPELMVRRIRGLIPLGAAVCVLFLLSRWQVGITEAQVLFAQVSPELEKLQRLRASYNWISTWIGDWMWHYLLMWAICLAAFLRLRGAASQELRLFFVGMPLIGVLSVPVSWYLLEQLKWSAIPQAQPQRALLFVTAFAVIGAAIAGLRAARTGSGAGFAEGFAWMFVCFAIPMQARLLELFAPGIGDPAIRLRVLSALLLAGAAVLAAWLERKRPALSAPAWAVALLAGFFLIPGLAGVRNYPATDTRDVDELSAWARRNTPVDAVFVFPDAGKQNAPGVFRAKSLRAVYVDWKSGGQVNFHQAFAAEWWNRWEKTMAGRYRPSKIPVFVEEGIDYMVLKPENRLAGGNVLFESGSFLAYKLNSKATPAATDGPSPTLSAR